VLHIRYRRFVFVHDAGYALFIRAAELSAAVSRRGPHAFIGIQTLEEVARCFILDKYKEMPVASMLIEFFELTHMLIFIDGLNEAVDNRCLVEESIDGQVETIPSG